MKPINVTANLAKSVTQPKLAPITEKLPSRDCLYCGREIKRSQPAKNLNHSKPGDPFKVVRLKEKPSAMAKFAGHMCISCFNKGMPQVIASETDLDSHAMK